MECPYIQPLPGYDEWRNFEGADKKAQTFREQSGNDRDNPFDDASKKVELGSGGEREVTDYHRSRFACYLIAQNGDPLKLEIDYSPALERR